MIQLWKDKEIYNGVGQIRPKGATFVELWNWEYLPSKTQYEW